MLNALKNQLVQLSEKSMESLDKRFGEQVTFQQAKTLAPSLRNFVLSLPELLQQTRLWFESPHTPPELRRIYGYVLTYVYHTVDLVPEEDYGFWGYLDDAYLVGMAYQKALEYNQYQPTTLPGTFNQQLPKWLAEVRQVIPQETETLDHLFGKLLRGELDAFNDAMASFPSSR
jgi:uncharacterized membrane protein YkvA (DUF1232 family)